MNYGKKEVEKTLRKTNSRSQKITSHLVLLLTKIILILVLFAAVLGISFGYGIFKGVIDAAPEIDVASIEPSGYATMVYDSKGNLTETLVKSGANRLEASYEELPQCLIDAFVAIEDSRFWSHKGVDVRSMFRAAFGIITGDSSAGGGSTLTQQLIKNNIFEGGNEDTFGEKLERKIQEQYLAIQLEKIMDKKIILKNYLNTINLGNNTLGVKAAALRSPAGVLKIETVGGEDELYLYKIDSLTVLSDGNSRVYYGVLAAAGKADFSGGGYDLLLNPAMF